MGIAFNPFTGNFDLTGSGVPGDITAVAAGTGLTGGGTTGDVTLSLANTAVTAGSYTYANITVDAQGRITSASSGSAPSATPGGSDTQIQFNDGGSFGADADLTYNKTSNKLTTKGDVELNDGGSFTTTVQCVTPTADRTISFPDATGTVGLVAGSSGQVVYNNAGAYAGLSTVTTDGTNVTLTGRFISSLNGAASAPPGTFTGTWFTGGTATTTKPQVLIEPTGATSTAWSTSGTGLGVNAASGFAGNLLDLQVNGTSQFRVSPTAFTWSPAVANSIFNVLGASSTIALLGTGSGFVTVGAQSSHRLEIRTSNSARVKLDTVGSLELATALTVATLPGTPVVGMIARVTDATAPAVGSTVTGGGAAAALVWYNGASWSVIGV